MVRAVPVVALRLTVRTDFKALGFKTVQRRGHGRFCPLLACCLLRVSPGQPLSIAYAHYTRSCAYDCQIPTGCSATLIALSDVRLTCHFHSTLQAHILRVPPLSPPRSSSPLTPPVVAIYLPHPPLVHSPLGTQTPSSCSQTGSSKATGTPTLRSGSADPCSNPSRRANPGSSLNPRLCLPSRPAIPPACNSRNINNNSHSLNNSSNAQTCPSSAPRPPQAHSGLNPPEQGSVSTRSRPGSNRALGIER